MGFVFKLLAAALFTVNFAQVALSAETTALPPLNSYFQNNDLQYIKAASSTGACPEKALISLDETDKDHPTMLIDRMPVEDDNCIPNQPQQTRYKLHKHFSPCGKVVYTDSPDQGLQLAQLVIIDNRTGTCDDEHATKAMVVIRETVASGADFFKIR